MCVEFDQLYIYVSLCDERLFRHFIFCRMTTFIILVVTFVMVTSQVTSGCESGSDHAMACTL